MGRHTHTYTAVPPLSYIIIRKAALYHTLAPPDYQICCTRLQISRKTKALVIIVERGQTRSLSFTSARLAGEQSLLHTGSTHQQAPFQKHYDKESGQDALRGAEAVDMIVLVFEVLTPEKWSEMLEAPL